MFQNPEYREVTADAIPPKAVLAVARSRDPKGPTGFSLHATDVAAAREVLQALPAGPAYFHMTAEWPFALLEPRCSEPSFRPAWLFALDAKDFVDRQTHEVAPVTPEWSAKVAKLWEPEWSSEPYVRGRIEAGPSFGVYIDGELVAWDMTHFETDRVVMMGFLHVVEGHRGKGYAKSAGSALVREILRRGKIPVCHVYADNVPSLELTAGLGFHRVTRQVWADAVLR